MLDALVSDADRMVVVDVKTTGLYDADRIVEVAAVTLNPRGRVVDEWDTLVNPERDVGPTHLHGVSATMVSAAPTFERSPLRSPSGCMVPSWSLTTSASTFACRGRTLRRAG